MRVPPRDLPPLEVVLLEAGGVRLALVAATVEACLPGPPGDPSPSLAGVLGLASAEPPAFRLKLRDLAVPLTIPACPVQGTLAPGQVHRVPALLAGATALRGLRALALDDRGLVLVVDPRQVQPRGAGSPDGPARRTTATPSCGWPGPSTG